MEQSLEILSQNTEISIQQNRTKGTLALGVLVFSHSAQGSDWLLPEIKNHSPVQSYALQDDFRLIFLNHVLSAWSGQKPLRERSCSWEMKAGSAAKPSDISGIISRLLECQGRARKVSN